MSCWSAALWLSVSEANEELADGFHFAVVMSVTLASSRSMEDAVGMGTFVGTRSACHRSIVHMSL